MKRILLSAFAAGFGTIAIAETAPSDVTFGDYGQVEMSVSGAAGDPAAGREIMANRGKGNCIACHQVTALEEFPFHGEVGPSLDGAGSRWEVSDLRGIVSNSKMTFPESVMPAFYMIDGFTRPGDGYTGKAAEGPLDPILTAQEVEDVVAYLMTLQD
ncbi:MAG: sulfur-oxidizing protein SoxX [Paracoccaceae bacterium]|jgi:sulfur-oxidizing protein SoxX